MSDDLVKRIRNHVRMLELTGNGKMQRAYDMREAAARIEQQAEEIDRMRAQLSRIAEYLPMFDYCGSDEFGIRMDRPGSPYDRGREQEAKHLSWMAAEALKEASE